MAVIRSRALTSAFYIYILVYWIVSIEDVDRELEGEYALLKPRAPII